MKNPELDKLSRDELVELIELYSKNWLAMDGVWFQSVERKFGMKEAVEHDANAWGRYAAIEARRLKEFLKLPEEAGLEGLAAALKLRFYANLNRCEYILNGRELVFRTLDCRAQTARTRKGLPNHPCKPVGICEYTAFAAAIDPRIQAECISCHPEVTDPGCACSWRFTLKDE